MEVRSRDLADSIFEFLQIMIMKCEYDKDVRLPGRICFSLPSPTKGKG